MVRTSDNEYDAWTLQWSRESIESVHNPEPYIGTPAGIWTKLSSS